MHHTPTWGTLRYDLRGTHHRTEVTRDAGNKLGHGLAAGISCNLGDGRVAGVEVTSTRQESGTFFLVQLRVDGAPAEELARFSILADGTVARQRQQEADHA